MSRDDGSNGRAAGLSLQLSPDLLRPLVAEVVRETVAALDADRARLDGRLAYPEAEAARLLSLQAYQLRDERIRGRIKASVGPGRRVLYSRGDLLAYLADHRWERKADAGAK